MERNIAPDEAARIIGAASRDAVTKYLRMCQLDSPWEVPESFLASEAAIALAHINQRVAIEFKLNRAWETLKGENQSELPERLRGDAHLDLAILRPAQLNPYTFTVDGVVEFKKQSSLQADTDLIECMIKRRRARFGVLVLFVVGKNEDSVKCETERWLKTALGTAQWRPLREEAPGKCAPLENSSGDADRCWNISCLVISE